MYQIRLIDIALIEDCLDIWEGLSNYGLSDVVLHTTAENLSGYLGPN